MLQCAGGDLPMSSVTLLASMGLGCTWASASCSACCASASAATALQRWAALCRAAPGRSRPPRSIGLPCTQPMNAAIVSIWYHPALYVSMADHPSFACTHAHAPRLLVPAAVQRHDVLQIAREVAASAARRCKTCCRRSQNPGSFRATVVLDRRKAAPPSLTFKPP